MGSLLLRVGFFCLLAITSVITQAQTNSVALTNFPVRLGADVWRIGFLSHPALTESSGVTASKTYPGVFWTHRDDGDPFIFAVTRTGEFISAFEVKGANLIDWEAISADDFGNLYLADIGTNGMVRTHSAIHRVEEPNPYEHAGYVEAEQTWYIRYPTVRDDAESFFILDGYGYLITKERLNGFVSMYRFLLGSSTEYVLEFVAHIAPGNEVGDAALSTDHQRLALVTDEGVEVYFINGDPRTILSAPMEETEHPNSAMEGVTFVPEGLLVTSEEREVLLFDNPQLTGAPQITRPLADETVYPGDTAVFNVVATGFPNVTFTWLFNGSLLRGQTNSSLIITNVTLANAGLYEVIVSNANGTARSSARLTVLQRTVDVRITEVMSDPSAGALPKADWFELTSFDTNIVDLGGWRFLDDSADFAEAFRIPDGTIIRPGESIIFVEDLTPAQFRAWWGAGRIPPETQIITYTGFGFSDDPGDELRLWTDETDDPSAVYARVSFGVAQNGISFGYDPVANRFGDLSVVSQNGAFRSVDGADVGSPGRIRNPPIDPTTVDVRITEVMSSPGTNVTTLDKQDWWELTNFDTNTVDLSGWSFDDSDGTNAPFVIPDGVTVAPGESIIFVEDLTPAEFRAWWGETNFAPGTQIITYSGEGLSFSSQGDSLRLWTTNQFEVFREVAFGPAANGVSFGYNPLTETFGIPSRNGEHGAFISTTGDDVGSPGRIRNPPVIGDRIDLRITEIMSSELTPNVEDWWELTSFDTVPINLSGWMFNDESGGFESVAVIPNNITIQPGESIIFVEDLTPDEFLAWWGATNIPPGTQIITYNVTNISFSSDRDTLRLWTNGTTDVSQTFATATFGTAVPGASFGYNIDTQQLEPSTPENGAVRAVAGPDFGSPGRIGGGPVDVIDVRITEVMSSPADGAAPTQDWWELTSFDTEQINLSGWRFNDNAGDLETNAFVIPINTFIDPGESIIFVEELTPEEFRAWWGPTLSPTVKIITYSGDELSFSGTEGDSLRLWTTDTNFVFTQVDFGPADLGVSFGYDPVAQRFGQKSTNNVDGAFIAATGPDVGSPGRIRDPALFRVEVNAQSGQIEISAPPTAAYAVEITDNIGAGIWIPTGEVIQGTNAPALLNPAEGPMRFYRLRKL